MAELLRVVVVFSEGAGRETCLEVRLRAGSTVADAIEASGLARLHPSIDFDAVQVGIWGRSASRDRVLLANDRAEVYRPLTVDPKLARARRAEKKGRSERAKR